MFVLKILVLKDTPTRMIRSRLTQEERQKRGRIREVD